MYFKACPTIPEIMIVEPDIHADERGFFLELYHKAKFDEAGIGASFVQDNRSFSRKGTLRGLHYQVNKPQGKLIWALSGEVFDVAVDIRRGSSRFGKWFGILLSGENKRGLYVPPDFAHGFCVLSKEAEVFYKCTQFYAPQHERTLRWNDPDLAIEWPINDPILSARDAEGAFLRDAELPQW